MTFRMDKLTTKAQEAVVAAQQLATERGHAETGPLHLLHALMAESDGIIVSVLQRMDVNIPQLKALAIGELDRLPSSQGGAVPQASRELQDVLQAAAAQAEAMQDEYTSTEH